MFTASPMHLRRRLPSGGGFTLIELVAVLVILAVLSGVAVATLSSLQDTRGAMAAKRLLRDLTFARQRSLATGARTWVVLDVSAQTWSLLAEDPDHPDRADATPLVDRATGRPHTITLNSDRFVGVTVQSVDFDGDNEVGFDWLGRPLNASEAALASPGVVTLSGGQTVTVAVDSGLATYTAP